MRQQRIPQLTFHRKSGQAVVRLSGKDFYCGKFGTPEAQTKYNSLVAEWLAGQRQAFSPTTGNSPSGGLTVAEGMLRFMRHATVHYRHPDGTATSELDSYRLALRPLRALYEDLALADFSPLKFKAVRQQMISNGLSRRLINQHCGRIKRMFKYLVSEELCPGSVLEALKSVTGLQQGRSEARETRPVQPVSQEDIDKVLPFLRPQIVGLIRFQLLTGCRPGEACSLQMCHVDRSEAVWVFSPPRHKLSWRGKPRRILIGPACQEMLKPFIDARDPEAFVFSPSESWEEHLRERSAKRKSKITPSQMLRTRKRRLKKKPRLFYSAHSYGQAVAKACLKAGVPLWRPNRLRHTSATLIRRQFGLEAAQVILGHSKCDTSQIYAERDFDKAEKIISEIG